MNAQIHVRASDIEEEDTNFEKAVNIRAVPGAWCAFAALLGRRARSSAGRQTRSSGPPPRRLRAGLLLPPTRPPVCAWVRSHIRLRIRTDVETAT